MSFSMSLNCTPFTRPVWKKVWGSACPSSRREASASPATTYSTCSASCRLHARSRTSSSTSGCTTTRSSLSGRQPIFTRNRATPRIAFGESPRGCLLKRVTLLYYQVILVSVMVFILVAGRFPSREDLIILSFRPKQIWNISDIALYCTIRSTLINTFANRITAGICYMLSRLTSAACDHLTHLANIWTATKCDRLSHGLVNFFMWN